MGWWKVQNTEDIIGDEVFDMLRDATIAIAQTYEREFGRAPTRSEWQLLMHDALEPVEELEPSSLKSLIAENVKPRAVRVLLEGLDADEK